MRGCGRKILLLISQLLECGRKEQKKEKGTEWWEWTDKRKVGTEGVRTEKRGNRTEGVRTEKKRDGGGLPESYGPWRPKR